jgi:hypothetical protein
VVALAAVVAATMAGTTAAQAVIGADEGANAAYGFAARVQIGDRPGRACSGALVAPQWVLTAKTCFTTPVVGAPTEKTTVTVGRTDLRVTAGHVLDVTRLVPHPDRDVILMRLAARVTDVPPVPVATSAPQAEEQLRLIGFGRTADEWVPDRLHGATVSVTAIGSSTLDVSAVAPETAAVCKGDAGGAALRGSGASAQLVAIHHASGQLGCLDAAGTTSDAVETRVDDVAGWIAATAVSTCNTAGVSLGTDQGGVASRMPDWTGECSADIVNHNGAGELHAWRGGGDLSADGRLFSSPRRTVGSGWTVASKPRIVSGDFNGDGRTDIVSQNTNGELRAWPSSGDLSADGRLFSGGGVLVGTGFRETQVETIITADVDGDGTSDVIGRYADGRLRTWKSTGDLSADAKLLTGQNSLAAKLFPPADYPRILAADVTGDGRSDLIAQAADGSLSAWASSGDLSGATPLWQEPARVIGTGFRESQVSLILTGDVDGDGKADLGARYTDGRVRFWQSTGDLTGLLRGGQSLVTGTFTATEYPRLLIGDADNDGRTDLVMQAKDGRLLAYRSTGDTSGDGKLYPGPARLVGTSWTTTAYPRIF